MCVSCAGDGLVLSASLLPTRARLLELLEPYKADKPLQQRVYESSQARKSSLQRDIRIAKRVAKHKAEDAAELQLAQEEEEKKKTEGETVDKTGKGAKAD
jgi:hypothetical protein